MMALADTLAGWVKERGRELRAGGDVWLRASGVALQDQLSSQWWAPLVGLPQPWRDPPNSELDPTVQLAGGNRAQAAIVNVTALIVSALSVIGRYAQSGWGKRFQDFDRAFRPTLPDPGQIIEGYRRRFYTYDQTKELLERHGLTNEAIQVYIDQRDYLPTPADLVSFAVREAFEPDQIQTLALFTDFESVWLNVKPWAEKNGLTEATFRLFWYSHWQPLSVGQAIELHRRYPEQYPVTWVEAIAKANEVVPSQVPALLNLTEDLLTLVNIQRAYELGIYQPADVEREGKRRGLSDKDAAIFRQIAVGIKDGQLQSTRRARADLTRPQYEQAYREGILSKAELGTALTELGFDPTEREVLIALQDASVMRDIRQARIRAVKTLYVRKIWQASQVREELGKIGILPDAVARMLEVWDLDILGDGPSPEAVQQRDLTKAEVLDAYQNRILEPEDARTALVSLGYDPQEIATLLSLADAKLRRAEALAVEQSVHDAYVAGQMSRTDAVVTLDGINVPTARREALLRRWDIEALRRGQQFTIAQIEKLARASLIDDARAKRELTSIRYTDEQADLLLQLWGLTEQPPELQ
jgi:Holliday junction resolvasome RuvABC DNA-binding subunit